MSQHAQAPNPPTDSPEEPSPEELASEAAAGRQSEFSLASQTFNQYVKCRWPIRVFALDPVTQDQNVADAYSRRRETQVAVALAFAGGNMNAQAMMKYARRLEWDMATIALNRTAVAFSHGDDTFGWRFYPRFQTPPIKGQHAGMHRDHRDAVVRAVCHWSATVSASTRTT